MRKFIGLILSIILFSSILPIFADEGYFENYNRQLYRQPTVCVFEPDDITLPDTTWKYWYSESMKGIDEWENRLKNTSSKNWDINVVEVTKEKLKFLNSSGCDINIRFLDSSHFGADANSFNGWYSQSTKSIEIIRNQMTYCGKYLWEPYGIFLDKYCRGDDLERGKKMAATVKHEFGHAFGLGHFVSDNRELMQSWYANPLGAPSIMAAAPSNEDVRQITQIDIERVLEIHGILGFGKEKNTEPVFIYPEKIISEPAVSSIQNIQVKPYQTTSTKITGYIPEELYSRGTPVEFEVTKPDGSKESFATMVSRHQYFEYPMIFDSNSMSGTYHILVIYKGEFVQKTTVNVSKSSTSTNPQNSKIEQKTPTQTNIFNPSLYAIDENGKKSKTITVKPDQKFSVEGYIYKNNIPQEYTAYKIHDNIGNTRDGTTNSNGFFKHIFTAKHSNYQIIGQGDGKGSAMIINVCVSSNCEDVTIYIRGNDHTLNISKIDETESKKQNLISENEQDYQKQTGEKSKNDEEEKQLKEMVLTIQSTSYSELEKLREGVIIAEDTLKKVISETPDQKETINKAWNLLKNNKQKLNDIEYKYREGDKQIGYEYYGNAKSWYDASKKDTQQVGDNLKEISEIITQVEKMQKQNCFLIWCW